MPASHIDLCKVVGGQHMLSVREVHFTSKLRPRVPNYELDPQIGIQQWEDRWEGKETRYFLLTPSSLPPLHMPAGSPSYH